MDLEGCFVSSTDEALSSVIQSQSHRDVVSLFKRGCAQ
jgi:hypothetical protein